MQGRLPDAVLREVHGNLVTALVNRLHCSLTHPTLRFLDEPS